MHDSSDFWRQKSIYTLIAIVVGMVTHESRRIEVLIAQTVFSNAWVVCRRHTSASESRRGLFVSFGFGNNPVFFFVLDFRLCDRSSLFESAKVLR
jgi:hypothetical protein|mmetsp:Transcript_13059/g.20516  ORF Transcript_13059/g.20516 Transcript_13059/m.20516 type:complete len:95 (+) Transcript_13059:993-1277(+)